MYNISPHFLPNKQHGKNRINLDLFRFFFLDHKSPDCVDHWNSKVYGMEEGDEKKNNPIKFSWSLYILHCNLLPLFQLAYVYVNSTDTKYFLAISVLFN